MRFIVFIFTILMCFKNLSADTEIELSRAELSKMGFSVESQPIPRLDKKSISITVYTNFLKEEEEKFLFFIKLYYKNEDQYMMIPLALWYPSGYLSTHDLILPERFIEHSEIVIGKGSKVTTATTTYRFSLVDAIGGQP